MKRLILIKQHPVIQLGHLYEHLFTMHIKQYMNERELYKMLDFSLLGTTYEHGGIIEIVIDLYSPRAIDMESHILEEVINFDQQSVIVAINQISAEEDTKLYIADKHHLLEELRKLSELPWKNAESISFIDTKSFRRRNHPIYATTEKVASPQILSISITSKNISELPQARVLFSEFSRFLLLSVADSISRSGYYVGYQSMDPIRASRKVELLIAKNLANSIDVQKVADEAREVVTRMVATRANDFLEYLYSISDVSVEDSPDPERVHSDSGVYVGADGWRKVANSVVHNTILTNLELTVKIGRQKITLPIIV